MKLKTNTVSLCASLVALLFLVVGKAQTLTYEIPLTAQLNKATLVVEGRVVTKQSYWDSGRKNIYTIHKIAVSKVFKGGITNYVNVVTPGGTVGLENEVVEPSLALNDNDTGLFILEEDNVNFGVTANVLYYHSVSAVQGFYQYDFNADIAANSYEVIQGINTTFYNTITSGTGSKYVEVANWVFLPKQNTIAMPQDIMGVTSFTPAVGSAGTQTIVTIIGSGFGSQKGMVKFKNSDTGGNTYVNALSSEIISWNTNQIKVEIPAKAGTGSFIVETASGNTVTTAGQLEVQYAENNIVSDYLSAGNYIAYPVQHINKDNTGGYNLVMSSGFEAVNGAENAFLRALDSWVCYTGINLMMDGTVTDDVTESDDLNIVRFDMDNELPLGVLGRCTTRSTGCEESGTLHWYVRELDFRFDDGANWNYDEGVPLVNEFDFESIAVHEIGHAHQLNHVIDDLAIMHYSLDSGEANRDLSAYDLVAGEDVQSRSVAFTVCNKTPMTNSPCSLGVDDFIETDSRRVVVFYKKPSRELVIDNEYGLTLQMATLYDANGRKVVNKPLQSSKVNMMSLLNLERGIYIVDVTTLEGHFVNKIAIY